MTPEPDHEFGGVGTAKVEIEIRAIMALAQCGSKGSGCGVNRHSSVRSPWKSYGAETLNPDFCIPVLTVKTQSQPGHFVGYGILLNLRDCLEEG